jgi:cytoskeletal protein CcmA (bactofilin family)
MWNKSVESFHSSTAVIGATMAIKGKIESKEDLYIDGDVQGSLDLKGCRLTVGPHGKVSANAIAREVIVLGEMKGNVDATEKIAIRTSGSLIGDIRASGIVIDDDAYFKGSIDIVAGRETSEEKSPEKSPENE